MKRKRVILIVILACIAAVVVGYAAYKNSHTSTTKTTKTVKQANMKKSSKTSSDQSTDNMDQDNQSTTSDQSSTDTTIKNIASEFYKAAYSKDYTKAKSMMTSDFAAQFDALLAGDESQVNASVVRDISTYTDVSTPTSVSSPSVIQKDQTYQVTLKLGKSYEAKVNLQKDGDSYKVYAFSSQDTSLGEGGYAGSSMN